MLIMASMTSKLLTLVKMQGYAGRCNDVLYLPPEFPISKNTKEFLLFFGGDTQDMRMHMEQNLDSKKFVEWNLENTTHILADRFPKKHVFVIRPSRMSVKHGAVFSCYDNFVQSDEYGIPIFCPTHNALKHLRDLFESSVKRLKLMPTEVGENIFHEETDLTLIGFSKGCVVLNQFLHEFHYCQTKSESDTNINRFINSIKSMWWLDGGHAGNKDTWITNEHLLKSFAKLKISVNIHVTPYQIQDDHRPWIRVEENQFCETLQKLGVSVQHTLHFENKPPNLLLHFDILKAIK